MCGIAGVVSREPLTDAERAAVDRMNRCLVHRGPDASGAFFDDHVALAMRRLSIIDLAGGQQPMFNETGRLAVICNGEIYNYIELREELLGKGHRFKSRSDVETIVHLYEERGPDFLHGLRGMFALALWDGEQRRLLLARDRMGEKPLYWCRDSRGRVWFASEMKSLLAAPGGGSGDLSPAAVNLFLTYQYVPEPRTMFEGVQKLPAGHVLEIGTREPGAAVPRRYWDYLTPRRCAGDVVDLVRAELEQACRIMGRADVPVGIALSGGIDSTVVAALSARTYPGTLQAFSVGYPGRPENDERSVAGAFARRLGIPFFDAELTEEDFVGRFPQLVWAMDDPIADIAAYGYYAVSELAREHGVPVLFSGLGGDELFWGYSWVREAVRRTERKRRLRSLPRYLQRMLGADAVGPADRMVFYDMHEDLRWSDEWSRALLTDAALERVPPGLWTRCFESRDWDRVPLQLSDVLNQTWLVSNCLALADRTSMAHSIEMRLPLLDVPLIELVSGFRQSGLADWRRPHKWLLVEAVKDLLPPDVLSRAKQGFTPPGKEWMRAVRDRYGSLVAGGALVRRSVLKEDAVERYMATAPDTFAYKLVLLEVWCRLFVDGVNARELVDLGAREGGGRVRAVSA